MKHAAQRLGRRFTHWLTKDGRARIPRIPSDYHSPDDLADRLVFRLLNEAVACLRERIVADTDLPDAGVIFGTGFAPVPRRTHPLHSERRPGAYAPKVGRPAHRPRLSLRTGPGLGRLGSCITHGPTGPAG